MAYPVMLQALADPTRRQIFETIVERPRNVRELADGLPVSRPAVSQHLRVLRDAGLVTEHREGTRRIHRADPAGLAELRAYVERMWSDALADFAAAAEEAPPNPRRSDHADP
ncbi:MAG TPA: metalloregulator ArsR/SmtB family transcription factor [Gaiellales bacterium]